MLGNHKSPLGAPYYKSNPIITSTIAVKLSVWQTQSPCLSQWLTYFKQYSVCWQWWLPLWALGSTVHPAHSTAHPCTILYHSSLFDAYHSCLPNWIKMSLRTELLLLWGPACVHVRPARPLLVPAPSVSCSLTTSVTPDMRWPCQEDAVLLSRGSVDSV